MNSQSASILQCFCQKSNDGAGDGGEIYKFFMDLMISADFRKVNYLLTRQEFSGSITKNPTEEGGAPIMTHGYGMTMGMMDMGMMPMATLQRVSASKSF